MTIQAIDAALCETCATRMRGACPVVEACPVDVIRADREGKPYIAYGDDCTSCFLCQVDCPNGAVTVSPEIKLPLLPY